MVQTAPSPRVLLVNDSTDEREMYAEWLRGQGCMTLQANNAADAYRLAVELKPQLVVTGVKLPGTEDGLALTHRIKHTEATRDVPVIVLSGYVFQADDDAARRAGCDMVIHKPCLPDALGQVVIRVLRDRDVIAGPPRVPPAPSREN